MLATLGGFLALLLGLLLLLLPLLAAELSRARDSVWGAVVLLLGLVLVTSAERLTGAPMLAVLCGGLLIGRLGVEVGQARWRVLSEEERQRLWSWERWRTSLGQLGASLARLLELASGLITGLGAWLAERRSARPTSTKRWVRPEPDATAIEAEPAADETAGTGELADPVLVVSGFEEIDALLEQALPEPAPTAASAERPEEVPDGTAPAPPDAGEGVGEAG
ncbi:MAG: Ycf66 family protein [Cyanobium sp. CZS 25K]|nr:Ycf66 family protein [Cyanobium sp. CZS25K]